MEKNPDPGYGMSITDHISGSLETIFGVKKILKLLNRIWDPFDPESWTLDGKIRIRYKHPGSATLTDAPFQLSSLLKAAYVHYTNIHNDPES
jgi:hypothetical protein